MPKRSTMVLREADLYPPVKSFLEAQGYVVKAEIGACDVMAIRADEPPVIVELKMSFTLQLLYQGIERQRIADHVYLAVPLPRSGPGLALLRLCRRLGLGLLCVSGSHVEAFLDPGPYVPRKKTKRLTALLAEFQRRQGDPNTGGTTGRSRITAYRQDALRCLAHLEKHGPCRGRDIVKATGVVRATAILRDNVYGWFERVERGIYTLTPKAEAERDQYAGVIKALLKLPD